MGVYASSASGRYKSSTDTPVDRLGLDFMAVLRPFAVRWSAADANYGRRVFRASGIELGLGYERDGQTSAQSGSRAGIHTGLRLELPLTRAGAPTELRVHLAWRHLVGLYQPVVGTVTVGDTTELFGALAMAF
jgi:hypothetical protein